MPTRPPWMLLPPALLAALVLVLPTVALLIRAPWADLPTIYGHADSADGVDVGAAVRLSLIAAAITTAIAAVLGAPLAWLLARISFPGRGLLRAAVTLPMVLPPVVGGLSLLLAFGRRGVFGQWLDQWFGMSLAFTPAAVVLAQLFVAMPFLVVTLEGAFRVGDRVHEEAAATLGASRMQVFLRVTVPMALPSLGAGMVLCWSRALGEFGATVLFAGNVIDHTQTAPTGVLTAFQSSPEEAIALSLPMILIAVVVLVALRDRWLRALLR
ncbi:ABC transporter permease [Nocardioides sp. Kera G14]|uniref:ABC transporter permease n=1 Tax=Nocardioides sp. Kera G14 TaxID=2884264 RepID=UPI001D100A43|nr:ABC transporter permease [Nocardioides sp. Kera G14]UDY23334.1 ABC transporter permease [Nocardioides sp. Kera G14]